MNGPPQPMGRKQFERLYEQVRVAVRDTYGMGYRDLAWSKMTYACIGKPGSRVACEPTFEHAVWLGVGVEGPQALRDRKLFIPCPFICGKCPACGGSLSHVRWQEDAVFEPTTIPGSVARFTLPTFKQARRLARNHYGGADYYDPSGRTR
jgi:hypothetical protein